MNTINVALRALMLLAVLALAGCVGDRFDDFRWGSSDKEKQAQKLTINMAGRWMFSAPNRGQCGMNFTGAPKATEGTIAPEGGCPGSFYTSRKWTLEDGEVVIRDHNGEQLAKLAPSATAGGGQMWFEGQAVAGERVMLARQ
jgi:protease inhibitor Inh